MGMSRRTSGRWAWWCTVWRLQPPWFLGVCVWLCCTPLRLCWVVQAATTVKTRGANPCGTGRGWVEELIGVSVSPFDLGSYMSLHCTIFNLIHSSRVLWCVCAWYAWVICNAKTERVGFNPWTPASRVLFKGKSCRYHNHKCALYFVSSWSAGVLVRTVVQYRAHPTKYNAVWNPFPLQRSGRLWCRA